VVDDWRQLLEAPAIRFHGSKRETHEAILIGVPYDLGNVVAPGARRGPQQIRLDSAAWSLPAVDVADGGDLRFAYGENPTTILARLGQVVGSLLAEGLFPLVVGGDHSISYPIVERLQQDRQLTVLWLDAHTDFNHWRGPGAHNHKQVLRRICALPGVGRVVHLGLRGFTLEDELWLGDPLRIVRPIDLRRRGMSALLEHFPDDLPCHLSFDIDALDPVFAPGTSTPVPGGLTPLEVGEVIATVFELRKVLAMDLVEVNPSRDVAGRTSMVACWLLCKALIAHGRAVGARQTSPRPKR